MCIKTSGVKKREKSDLQLGRGVKLHIVLEDVVVVDDVVAGDYFTEDCNFSAILSTRNDPEINFWISILHKRKANAFGN